MRVVGFCVPHVWIAHAHVSFPLLSLHAGGLLFRFAAGVAVGPAALFVLRGLVCLQVRRWSAQFIFTWDFRTLRAAGCVLHPWCSFRRLLVVHALFFLVGVYLLAFYFCSWFLWVSGMSKNVMCGTLFDFFFVKLS